MDINPYEPSQVPVGDLSDGPQSMRVVQRILALCLCVGGGLIAGSSFIFVVQQCSLLASGIVPPSEIIPILLFIVLVPTMGMGIFLYGVDLWGGTKRFAKVSAILLAPFAFALIFVVFAVIFMLFVAAFIDLS